MPGFSFGGAGNDRLPGCKHFDFAISVTLEGNTPPRVDMSCKVGEQMAGIRTECNSRPVTDTGERRRVTDMGGDAS